MPWQQYSGELKSEVKPPWAMGVQDGIRRITSLRPQGTSLHTYAFRGEKRPQTRHIDVRDLHVRIDKQQVLVARRRRPRVTACAEPDVSVTRDEKHVRIRVNEFDGPIR